MPTAYYLNMKHRRSPLPHLAAFALLAAMPAHACINDRDTLAEEIKGLPDVAQIITGRFERNPPLYHQMRIDRSLRPGAPTGSHLKEELVRRAFSEEDKKQY